MNFKEELLEVLKSSRAKTFYWQTAVGFIGLLAMFIGVIQPEVINPTGVLTMSITLAGLNNLSKWINKTYL